MTGRLPVRSGTSRVPLPGLPQGFLPWEYTIAELLHDAGYSTAHYGKWHLGDTQGRYPSDQGFDEWYGFAHSSAETLSDIQPGYSPEVAELQRIEEGRRGEPTRSVGTYSYDQRPLMDEELTRRAVAYISAHAKDSRPFFLYVPFSLPHAPPLPNPKYRNPQKTDYQNVLHEIDVHAGAIIDAVDSAGIADRTIVVFTSDNGPETHTGNNITYGAGSDTGPFRGEFPSGWEGAIRVPFIIRWPGRIQPGSSSNEIVSMLDMYRTLASFAGASSRVPTDRPVDSIDQSGLFLGKQARSNRESVLIFHDSELLAVKWRNFKAHFVANETARGNVRTAGQTMFDATRQVLVYPWIFDVDNDPKELWNIAASNVWLGTPMGKVLATYQMSLAKYPNIAPGARELPAAYAGQPGAQ
jgi:arylsulfatase